MPRLETIIVRDDRPAERRWIDRVKDSVRAYWQGPWLSSDKALAQYLNWTPPASSGVMVSDDVAFSVAAFYSAATMIASDIAGLPLYLYKRQPDGGSVRYPEHSLNDLIRHPNHEQTKFGFFQTLVLNAATTGNGFAEVARTPTGRPTGLYNLYPGRCVPVIEGGVLQYRVDGKVMLPAANVIHLKGPSVNGVTGLDTVTVAKECLGASVAAQIFAGNFFGNGSTFGGLLSEGPGLTDQARENLRKALDARHSGSGNAFRTLMLPPGMTFQETGTKPRDSQLLELRTFLVRDVARFFRIPASKLGAPDSETYQNVESQNTEYVVSCLKSWMTALEQELSLKLIAHSERNIQHFEMNAEGLLRADSAARSAFLTSLVNAGIMSPNEARQKEGLAPIPGGDVPRMPASTSPISATGRSAHRDLLIETMDRARAHDVNRLERLTTAEGLREAAERIGDRTHLANLMFVIRPAVRAVCAAFNRETDTDRICESLAREYTHSTRSEVMAFADRVRDDKTTFESRLRAQVNVWKTTTRSARIVDDILKDITS